MIDLAPNEAAREVLELMSLVADIGRPIFFPPGVPAERVTALRRAFDATMKDPDFLSDAVRIGEEIRPASGERLQEIVQQVLAAKPATVELLKSALTPDPADCDKSRGPEACAAK
jgi:hypothetical protein